MDKKQKVQYVLLFLVDFVSVIVSGVASWLFLEQGIQRLIPYEHAEQMEFFAILIFVALAVYLGFNRSNDFVQRGILREFLVCLQSNLLLAAGLAIFMLLAKAEVLSSRYLYVCVIVFNTVLQFILHMVCKRYLSRHFYSGSYATLVGVVSTTDRAEALVKALKHDWMCKVQGVVLLDDDGSFTAVDKEPVVANFETFMDWIRREPLDAVYINVPYQTGESLRPYVQEIESMGVAVHLNMPQFDALETSPSTESWIPRSVQVLENVGGVHYLTLQTTQNSFEDMILKRLIDIVGAVVGLVISVPIIAVVAIPLKLESPGPLFFKQKRVGRNGRIFYIHKLRSMYVDAEERKQALMDKNKMQGLMFKVDNDPRITKVGKFIRRTSIDELPQFYDVLLGNMSLVGTRPPTLDEYNRYESHHKRRLSMKPGITGLWQVSGRSNIQNFEDVVRLDVTYIDNWSLFLDFKILLKTIGVVFRHIGAE